MNIKRFLLAALWIACAGTVMAQLNLPTKRLGNEDYYYYKVKGGESVYGIADKLGIGVDELVKYNPTAVNGVDKNQLLFLPVSEFAAKKKATAPATVQTPVSSSQVTHKVKSGESLYGIARTYGVTVEDLVAENPAANNGIRPNDELRIPTAKPAVTASPGVEQNDGTIFHTIKRGESLYSVAKLYNTSIENLIKLNPGVSATNFRADDVIKVKPNSTGNIVIEREIAQFIPYVARDGDSFSSIAAANGITVQQLQAANPDVKKLKKGHTIYIPKSGIDRKTVNTSQATAQELEKTYADKLDDVYNQYHNANLDNEINIAMILPFQLHKSEPPRQALLYTEFYKGFMMAMDSVGNNCGKKININVFDTRHNLDVTDSILQLEQLKTLDVIIAPLEPKQLERCNNYGKAHGIPVLNPFSNKNDDYLQNPEALQVYAPTQFLNSYIAEWMESKFKDHTVVYLEDPDMEKKDIYNDLKKHFEQNKHKTKTLTIIHDLAGKTLSGYMDPGVKYVFLPSNGNKSLFKKVSKALRDVKEDRFDCEVALVGYPEYTMMVNELQSEFKAIDTYIFSRFYAPDNSRTRSLESKYKSLYGEGFMPSAPVMGIYGFDVGMYVVNTLAADKHLSDEDAAYNGVQTTFRFKRASNWGGCYNESVQIVHFNGNGAQIIKR